VGDDVLEKVDRVQFERREVMNQNETPSKALAVDYSSKCNRCLFCGFGNEERAQTNGERVSPDYAFTTT
jgi:hypothetical protein